MNAVRLRKENQIISAQDKVDMALMKAEEEKKKEAKLLSEFRELVQTKRRGV